MEKTTTAQRVGLWLTFASAAATVVLIILKISGLIAWPWWWVIAPFAIPFGIIMLGVVTAVVIIAMLGYKSDDETRAL